MRISFLHTADVHIATFDAFFAELAPDATLTHRVNASLLERARSDGLDAVREDTLQQLRDLATADATICTCSTLGPLADEIGLSHVLRIDRPMMQQASRLGHAPLVALCLESTKDATLALLHDCATEMNMTVTPWIALCTGAWAQIENGDLSTYADMITQAIKVDITENGPVDCVVLAQASMRVAQDQLAGHGLPILSSPAPAARHAIALAKSRSASE